MNFFSLFKRKILYKLKKKINIDNQLVDKKNLDELFSYYGSDKANNISKTKKKGHGFSKFYKNELNHLKEKKINILEIGSYSGASAASFVKFYKNSSIYCIDINISNFIFSSKNIHVFGLDINNEIQLDKTLKSIYLKSNPKFFDIIIDDGSHNLSDILFSFKNLFKYVKKGGTYIIEDYKYPNYYNYNKNMDHILVDEILKKIKKKRLFNSNIFKNTDQIYLQKNIGKIKTYKGNLKDSDICFIKKN